MQPLQALQEALQGPGVLEWNVKPTAGSSGGSASRGPYRLACSLLSGSQHQQRQPAQLTRGGRFQVG